MDNETQYQMIFKRKSFHLFRGVTKNITEEELNGIRKRFRNAKPLMDGIKVDMQIVPADKTTCKRGQEYCILLYSEEKDNYLHNIGYIGEQIDLYLASINVGALWFGIGKSQEESYNGLSFVIMIAISKMPEDKFRKDMFKSKRKGLEEIWIGDAPQYANIVRFTPSACNTQPWIVEKDEDNHLKIYRYKKPGKRGIMPADKVCFYNQIDIGIFLCFLDICLKYEGKVFERKLYVDYADNSVEKTLIAEYNIMKSS